MQSIRPNRRIPAALFHELRRNKIPYLMLLPALTFIVIFNYVPLYGLQVAFKTFNFAAGIWKSPWVGFKNFLFFFRSNFFPQLTFNTLFLNALFISANLIMQVSTAILLNEVTRRQQKAYQTAMFFPYFISWVVVSGFVNGLLSYQFGFVNGLITSLGGRPVAWLAEPKYWPWFLTVIAVWKKLGYGSVIYLSSIVGIDAEIYEAAKIDGANKFQEITRITLPMLKPIITLMLLMDVGNMFRGDFQMIYSIIGENNKLLGVTEVIDTFVYRTMRLNAQYGLAGAVGLFQSVMGFFLVMSTNWLIKRKDPDAALF